SGDFTLMSRDAWLRTGGYPELATYAMHVDSLLLYQAHYSGIAERDLRFHAFHVEHESLSQRRADGLAVSNETNGVGPPRITDDQLAAWADEMRESGRPIAFNRDDWGFAGEVLPEQTVALAPRGKKR